MAAIDDPSGEEGQHGEQGRAGQCSQSPEDAEEDPFVRAVVFRRVLEIQGDQKKHAKKQSRQPGFPDALDGKINGIGTECPHPARPFSDAISETEWSGWVWAFCPYANTQPDHLATRSPKLTRPIRKTRTQARADIKAFSESSTIAEAF